jgi:hypothetical protein
LVAVLEWTAPRFLSECADHLALAKSCVAKELRRRLKGGEERGKIRTVHLRLTERQYEELSTSLLANGARPPERGRGFSGKEDALMWAQSACERDPQFQGVAMQVELDPIRGTTGGRI